MEKLSSRLHLTWNVLKLINYSFYPPIGNRGLSPYTPGFNYSHQDSEIKKKKIKNKDY